MITDQLASFLPPGSNLPITNVEVFSNVEDLLQLGVGVTAAQGNVITGTNPAFGADMGAGIVVPELICAVGTAFAGTGTLTITFEGAKDVSGSPGAWQVFDQTPAMTIAQLTAATYVGRRKWPFEFPDGFNPRFLRMGFIPSGVFTAGTIAYALVTMGPSVPFNKYQAPNYSVKG